MNTSATIKAISARWKAMTRQEQEAVAGKERKKLIECQQNKVFGVQNVEQNMCNDTNAVLASVSHQVRH